MPYTVLPERSASLNSFPTIIRTPSLVVSDNKKAVKVLLNFLAQDVASGKIKLRGEHGFPENYWRFIKRMKASVADKQEEGNPLQRLVSGNNNPEVRQQ